MDATPSFLDVLVENLFDFSPSGDKEPHSLAQLQSRRKDLTFPQIVGVDGVLSQGSLEQIGSDSPAAADLEDPFLFSLNGRPLHETEQTVSAERLEDLLFIQTFNQNGRRTSPQRLIVSYQFSLFDEAILDREHLMIALRNLKSFLIDERILVLVEMGVEDEESSVRFSQLCQLIAELNLTSLGPPVGVLCHTLFDPHLLHHVCESIALHELHSKLRFISQIEKDPPFSAAELALFFRAALGRLASVSLQEQESIKNTISYFFSEFHLPLLRSGLVEIAERRFSATQLEEAKDLVHLSVECTDTSRVDKLLQDFFA